MVIPDDHNFFKLSVSKSKTFKDCKKKYKFTYIDKLPRKDWDFQVFGTFLHQVLENFELDIIKGYDGPDNILMKKSFKSALNMPLKDGEKETFKDKLTTEQKKESTEILQEFLEKRYKQKKENKLPKVLYAEKPFKIDVDGKLLINGFIDVVQRDVDGVLHVADYKTSKSKKYLKNDFMQLKTYAYAMCLEDPDLQKIRCSYVMLRFGFDSIQTEFTRDEVMVMEKEFVEYAELMKKEKLFRASPSPLCKYCDHLEICDEGMRKQGIINSNFGETSW